MRYDMPVYRPPSEANSLILQVTIGCSHNACTFCGMYKRKKFHMREITAIFADIEAARQAFGADIRRVFLADGDALTADYSLLEQVLCQLRLRFPKLEQIAIYANVNSIGNKSQEQLARLRSLGLKLAYIGLETGDPDLAQAINKGAHPNQVTKTVQALQMAGFAISLTVILGLAGNDPNQMQKHARQTAWACNEICPDYLAALTLIPVEGTPLYRNIQKGAFILPGPKEMLLELRLLLAGLDMTGKCVFRANHASNYLPLKGTLPIDKEKLLKIVDDALEPGNEWALRPEYLRGL